MTTSKRLLFIYFKKCVFEISYMGAAGQVGVTTRFFEKKFAFDWVKVLECTPFKGIFMHKMKVWSSSLFKPEFDLVLGVLHGTKIVTFLRDVSHCKITR